MGAHAYSKILSEVPLRQREDGQYRPKHVVVHHIIIKYTSCDTAVFDYIPFPRLLLFLHARFVNQHTRKDVALCHQKVGHTGINRWENVIYPSAEVSRADQSYRFMNYSHMVAVKLSNRDRSCEINQRINLF